MSTSVSPPNAVLAVPADPAGLDQFSSSKDRLEYASKAALKYPQHATGGAIGAAGDSNKTALENFGMKMVASVEALAASTQALIADMEALAANVEALTANSTKFRRQMDQLPWVRVNSRPGDWGTLHNPTSIFPLTEPNPRNSEELLKFTVSQCIASAKSLGLPSLPQDTPVHERRRQIAIRLGVIID